MNFANSSTFAVNRMAGTLTSTSSCSSLKVLSLQSIQILRARGEAGQHEGYRAISNTSYVTANSLDSEATVLIPDELESLETLRFLELNETTAGIVWQQFLERQNEFPYRASILNSAKRYVNSIQGNAITDLDDWVEIMRRIGMSSNFQARIMKNDVMEMRLSGSLKQWIYEMMEIRYDFLLTLDSVIQTPSTSTLGRKSSKPAFHGSFSTQPAPAIPPRVSSQAGKGLELGSFNVPQPTLATVADDPPKQLEGHVMLLKGAARPRLDKLFMADGRLNFAAIGSTPPGDFSQSFRGVYLTKNYEVAWKYAQWAQALVDGNVVPVEILHVAVPQHLTASAKELYGEEWRRFVWACRRDDQIMPDDLIYLEDYQWLIGPVTHSSTQQIERMTRPAELKLWKLANNQTASHFYVGSMGMLRLLNEHCIGKVWRTAVHVDKKE